MDLTILMPCLNEAETLEICLQKAYGWSERSGLTTEVLVADNGSTDGSIELAESMGARVIKVQKRGYGSALFHGCKAAKGRWIIMGDADDSYDFSDLDAFVTALSAGNDLVMGNRFTGGIAAGAMPWKNRYIGNPVLSWLGRVLFDIRIRDFHCGLRAVSRNAFERMDLRTTGMEFASEMVIKAAQSNMAIAEVPTTLSQDGRSRPPHLRPWRDGWRHLRFMMLFSPRWLFLIPGLVILGLSALVYGRLLAGPLQLHGVTLDVHTLFFAQAAIVLGLLLSLTGVIAKSIGTRDGSFVENRYLNSLASWPAPEVGALVGGISVFLGLVWGVGAVAAWGADGFGPIGGVALLRTISLSTLLLTGGGVVLTFSLLLGFVSLPVRPESLIDGEDRAPKNFRDPASPS